ncbi:claudin-like protein zf-a89 isoform X1 [Ictalurus punctatus]|uniref:Claudin-like protein zf-a89 isoform X1 n=1 Tax=Ictalurus punctatus TaxID=7998 RepID=A0A9F7RN68_ICTPU|nr:claudin-like protein zf-a89 isoform X1 [Ictalurus punctatus]
MVSQKLQILGLVLALIGFVGIIVICGLPAWKMSAFIGANIVTFQVYWEGLWMDCVVQTTGQMQCKVYDSLLILPVHLQAARALIIIALVVGIFGIIVTIIGGKCTSFVQDESAKAKIAVTSGMIFIITGILVLIPVCWTINAIIRDFYNPALTDAQRRELGPCLYIGFGCAALLIAGGALLCSSCPPKDDTPYHVKYSQPKYTVSSSKVYVIRLLIAKYHIHNSKVRLSKMVSVGLQMLGAALGIIGWIGVIVVCALPMWRVTAFIGSNIVTSQIQWEGIWMNCVVQSTGQMQCKVYDSMLALSSDLQAARALTVISIVVGIFGILLAMAGGKCTNCVEDENSKAKVAVAAGVVFIISGVLCLIPVCWTAQTVIRDFYNPLVNQAQKRELGASLFIGWGAAALLIIGGGLLCASCPHNDKPAYTAKYSAPARSQASAPSTKDYV